MSRHNTRVSNKLKMAFSDERKRMLVFLGILILALGAGFGFMIYDISTTWHDLTPGGQMGYPITVAIVGMVWIVLILKTRAIYLQWRYEARIHHELMEGTDVAGYFEADSGIHAYGMP